MALGVVVYFALGLYRLPPALPESTSGKWPTKPGESAPTDSEAIRKE
jgi:hypothetical protein